VEECDHLAWALSSPIELPLEELPRRPWVERRAGPPEITDDEWSGALGETARKGHRLSAEQLRLVAAASAGLGGDVDAAVRRLASGHLDQHARRIRPRKKWDDLVLAPDKLAQLREIVSRYQHRDRVHGDWGFPAFPSSGLVAMFSGPSGTGKTLAAEIVAGELGLDLYKLDLSAVVSKYIGETEQNLERVFNAASAGNLVLFFDEADSLFGKRSEVTDARDRYANIEVSYLLQRLESYDGLVVMATNFQKNIDEAFIRRIHVSVEFPMPDEDERIALWRHAFALGAPIEGIDWDFLAKQFKLSGGSIKNAALHSAFLAAEAGTAISMETVILGLKREFQKLGWLRTVADFGPYTDLVT
jgi:AAA+ superfamily predicted ATPase